MGISGLRTAGGSLALYLFSVLFLISGAAGLIYQIVWERLLGLYFGVTMVSVTLIVSAFMAGLGTGSLIGGRLARSLRSPLFLYGLLEIGIAVFGVFSPALILWIGKAAAGVPPVLVFLISFLVLLVPTTLMGMTLPLLTQAFVRRVENAGGVIGLIYGINTLGAALGALIAGYLLIGRYGFAGTVYIAAGMNGLVGLAAVLRARPALPAAALPPGQPAEGATAGWGYRTILISSFLVGFIGLGLEMVWVRLLLIVNKNTAYAFPSILAIFLLGLALGGYLWGRQADRSRDPRALFCRIELAGTAVAALAIIGFGLSLELSPAWMENFFDSQKPVQPYLRIDGEWLFSRRSLLSSLWGYFLPVLILVLPASLILGGGLPVLDRIAIQQTHLSGRRVGDLHLANIVGSVAGALVVSFIWLPYFGSEWTIRLLCILALIFPVLYYFPRRRAQTVESRSGLLPVYSLLTLGVVLLLPERGDFYRSLYAKGTGQEAVISESGESVLALTYERDSDRQRGVFWIGGEVNSFFPPDGLYESRAMVCAGASRPERVLVIGFGGGYSALFHKSDPEIREIVIVELLPDVAPFLMRHLDSAQRTLQDPRVIYRVDDGRRYLNAFPDEKFDLISIDPLRDHTAGHNNLYSAEALQIYRAHLTPKGVLCAWMDEFHIIPHTAANVFPYVDQFESELLVAGLQPLSYDRPYMARMAERYGQMTGELFGPADRVVLDPARALGLFLRDRDQILRDEKHRPILRDLTPWLEYYLFAKPVKEDISREPGALRNFTNRIR